MTGVQTCALPIWFEVELVSSIDCPEQPENSSLHKAETLIDEAEKSIDKLRLI